MKVRLMSDLHLEFGPLDLKPAGEDVLMLAGDLGIYTDGLEWADEVSKALDVPVVMIAGNHEFYRNREHNQHTVQSTYEALREGAAKTNGRVTFLERETAVIGGVRFIGATLWTDFRLFGDQISAKWAAGRSMNDYRMIRFSLSEPFFPDEAEREHAASLAFITETLKSPFYGQTLVMTHHAPSRLSIAGRYGRDMTSAAYASDLDDLVETSGAVLWQHGHVHHSFDYMIGGTRVRTNPRGYDGWETNRDFDPNLVIDLSALAVSDVEAAA